MMKFIGSVSVIALMAAFPANAQEAPSGAGSANDSASSGVAEIIVTANRRSESVQKSSLAIAVVGGDQLSKAGVTQASDLSAQVPGLTIALGGSAVQTYLRGVGSFSTDANAESAIAYNINGVYISRPGGIGPIFYDLARVEVLKGPQGTLYGRNASGGAINLITNKPGQELDGYVNLEYGNYDLKRVTAAVGGPISDTLGVRVAGQWTKRDGYLTDGYMDQDTLAGRMIVVWEPTNSTKLTITGELSRDSSQGQGSVKRSLLTPVASDPWAGPSIGTIQQPPSAFIPGGTSILNTGFQDIQLRAISAEFEQDLGGATLTFIPAYRYMDSHVLTYAPAFVFDTAETSKQQSYELRLGNQSDSLKWVAGAYFFDEKQTQLYEQRALPFQNSFVDTPIHTRSYAFFGEATVSVSEPLRLIGGLRYSNDRKSQTGTTSAVLPAPNVVNNVGSLSGDRVTWKAGLEYDLAPENMLFATASTGYKAGGFFPSIPAPDNGYRPERLTAFTIGSRNRFANDTVQLNLEGFYWKYEDKQERYLGATPSGTQGLLTTNAGKATLYGGNIDLTVKPSRNGTFHFSAEYLHTKYDSFVFSNFNPPVNPVPFPGFLNSLPPQASGCVLGPVAPYTANNGIPVPSLQTDSTQSIDCSGKPLVRAPKWSGSVGYQHKFELSDRTSIVADIEGQYASSQYLSADFIDSGKDDGYFALNASLTFNLSNVAITAWGKNLTNEAIYTGGFRYPYSRSVAAGGDPTLFYAQIRAPRTYGVSVKASF